MTFNRKRLVFAFICSGIGLLAASCIVPAFGSVTTSGITTTRSVGLDLSMMFLITVVFSLGVGTAAYYLMGKKRPPPQGDCRKCGYDLTGNVSGVCPECGTEIEPA